MLWAQGAAAVVQTQSITPPVPTAPVMLRLPPRRDLNRFAAAFSRADADAIIQGQYKDFSVADFARRARAATFDDRQAAQATVERFVRQRLRRRYEVVAWT